MMDQSIRENTARQAAPLAGPDSAPDSAPDALPDLLGLDLAALRTLDHPVLSAVVADLRDRSEQPGETLWGFVSSF